MDDASSMSVGVLAMQGDVRAHVRALEVLGHSAVRVRRPEDVDRIDGLIIPGGESSVMDKLARSFGLVEPLMRAVKNGLPVFGTCAGMIMMARGILNPSPGQASWGVLDIEVRRNAFGTQNQSFETDLITPEFAGPPVHAVFIRAPVVETLGSAARALATLPDGRCVAVAQGDCVATSFHPEVTGEYRFHEYFLARVEARVRAQRTARS